jgi:dihydroorotate dehydrogenase electron transfer subunit
MHDALYAAGFYADRAVATTVTVRENVRLARDTYRVRVDGSQIARRIVPGQFIMLRLADCNDPLLGRPLALYDTVAGGTGTGEAARAATDANVGLDIVYLAVGKLTSRLARCRRGQELEVWGPLGNGFAPQAAEHLVMVAGGIGQTPFLALAQEYLGHKTYGDPPRCPARAGRVTLCYGARSADYLAGIADFERLGVEVRTSTDDGTAGHHGLVTDLLKNVLSESRSGVRVVCCGPEPMMHQVADLTATAGVPCQVSLETPMACGIGICFSCVARVRQEQGGWDYRRTCVEGPVFDAAAIEF